MSFVHPADKKSPPAWGGQKDLHLRKVNHETAISGKDDSPKS